MGFLQNLKTKRCMRWSLCFLCLFLAVAVFFLLNIGLGSVSLSAKYVWEIICGEHLADGAYRIVWEIRLPRALAAFFLGGALAVSGYALQTYFHNPIAGPFVLGISSGAKLVVAIVMIFLLGRGIAVMSGVLILAAFLGSMVCMGFILVLSRKDRGMSSLVIGGVMIGYICSAVTDMAVTFASDADIVNLHNWSMGSFSGTNMGNVRVMAVVVAAAVLSMFFMSKPISAYSQGEEYAKSVGVNVRVFRILLIILSGILSACVTAFAGPISFVGIAVPYLVKSLFKTSKPLVIIPGCFLGGAVCCLACDLLARTVFAPTEISISSVTALFGAPVVIYMLFKRRREC